MLRVLDAAALRAWCAAGSRALAGARDEIDDLNVYPVPDGDTGTNLLLTFEAVRAAAEAVPGADDLPATVRAMAQGALLGARGNSGVLLSQLLRGLADALSGGSGGAAELARGLVRGAERAHEAVAVPAEGTLLTVAAEAAQGAVDAAAVLGTGLAGVVGAAREAAERALVRTTEQLPALRRAGVVDAGGRGWVVLLQALERVVTSGGAPADPGRGEPGDPEAAPRRDRSALVAAREAGSPEYAYEVQYLLSGADEGAAQRLRGALTGLGDSVVVVGAGSAEAGAPDLLHVHVHVNDVQAAVDAGARAGRPSQVTVTRFEDQVEGPPSAGRAVVVVCAGEGLARLCADAGARVLDRGPGVRPPVPDVLAGVRAAGAVEVAVLPDDEQAAAAATAAAVTARADGLDVRVVPTGSPLQALAALAVADARRPFADDVAAMAAAAAGTRSGSVVLAVTGASTSAGLCLPGDALGLLEGRVVLVGAEVGWVARGLVDRLLPGADLLTLVVGEGAPPGLAASTAARARESSPGVEVVVVEGGPASHPLLLGAE